MVQVLDLVVSALCTGAEVGHSFFVLVKDLSELDQQGIAVCKLTLRADKLGF